MEAQLRLRISAMEPGSNQSLERLERQRDSAESQAGRAMARRLEHVQYFHGRIVQRHLLRQQECECQLKTQISNMRTELACKNKLLDGSATASDFDHALHTLQTNHLTLLQLRDNAIQNLESQLKDSRSTFDMHCSKAKTEAEKKRQNVK